MRLRICTSIVAVGALLSVVGVAQAAPMGAGGHAMGGGGHAMGGGGHGLGGGMGGGHGMMSMSHGAMQTSRGVASRQPNASFARVQTNAAPNVGFGAQAAAANNGQRMNNRRMGNHFAENGRRFRGFGYGVGALGLGYGAAYGYDGYDGGYDDYSAGYGDPAYGDPSYGAGVQYSQGPYEQEVQTGRSAATVGDTCSTPVKACTLYNQSYVGNSCSCKVPGGRASGRVTP